MKTLTLPSPAKLNLFLHILNQRPDGYHTIQTLFQLLDYGDEITFTSTSSNDIRLSTTPSLDIHNDKNLIYQAATLLRSSVKPSRLCGVDIHLSKKLPMGGGIGGGSSNAATTLLALNHLWETNLSNAELCLLGRQLGADVPVFVAGHTAWAEGIGDQLSPIQLPTRWYLVIKPSCHVSTSAIFSHKELTRGNHPITVAAFLEQGGINDCQQLVENIYPQVKDAVNWLNKYAQAQLTGTGACIFASFDSYDTAQQILCKMPEHLSGFIAKGINQSPVTYSLS